MTVSDVFGKTPNVAVRYFADKLPSVTTGISTEDVPRLKATLAERAPKTVNNVLTVLTVVLRTAVEWA